jgi:hypothetical protein
MKFWHRAHGFSDCLVNKLNECHFTQNSDVSYTYVVSQNYASVKVTSRIKCIFHERVLHVLNAQNILNLLLQELIASGNKRPKQYSLFNNVNVLG